MSIDELDAINCLEAAIFASETPVSMLMLRQLFEESISTQQLSDWLTALATRHQAGALELARTASGFRFQVRANYAARLSVLWPERPIKLSQALLETLSVIAYRQPVTRGDIEQIRGVTVNSQILRALFERGWIAERGYREVAGRPALLVTTRQFLDAFGLTSLADLPPLSDTAPNLAPNSGQATNIGHLTRIQQDLEAEVNS